MKDLKQASNMTWLMFLKNHSGEGVEDGLEEEKPKAVKRIRK